MLPSVQKSKENVIQFNLKTPSGINQPIYQEYNELN